MERSFRRLSFVPVWLLALLFVANDGLAQAFLVSNHPCPGSTLTVTSPHPIRTIEWIKDNNPFATIHATWKGTTLAGGNGDGPLLNQFDSALAMAIDAAGNIYVSDLNNHRVLMFPPGSDKNTAGIIVAGGNGQGAALNQLNDPAGIYIDATGHLYVADMGNHRVLKFPPNSTSATDGAVVAGGAGLGQALTQFNSPISICIDGSGRLYVADRDNHRVLRYVDANGTNLTGTVVAGGLMNGAGLTQLDQPVSITLYNNQLLVAEYRNHRVTSWDPDNPTAGSILVAGIPPGWGNGLNQLHYPTGIFVDAAGELYIADSDNDRIMGWLINPAPATTGINQLNNTAGTGDDQLDQPLAVYRTATGDFIVLDLLNNRVQQFTPTIVTTYTPAEAGTYRVIVTDDQGNQHTSPDIVIPPVNTATVTISAASATICPGTTTSFTAVAAYGGTTPTYTWQLNGVDQPVVGNVFHPVTLQATDQVRVVMQPSGDAGCLTANSATSNIVTVALYPALAIKTIEGPTSLCRHSQITLSNTTVSSGHQWKSLAPAIATIDANSGLLRGIDAGSATIRYYATSGDGCTDSTDAIISVDVLISANVTVSPTSTASCKGKPVTFTVSGFNTGTAPVYTWLVNGISTGVNGTSFSSTTLQNNDAVQVRLTPSADAGCLDNISVTSMASSVTIHPLPVMAPITGGLVLCDQSSTQLSNATTNTTSTWKSVNEAIALVDGTGKVAGISAGQAEIRFIATTPDGCVDSVRTIVTVGALVVPTITVTPATASACSGKEIRLTASSLLAGTKPTYAWQVNGMLTGAAGTVYTSNDLQAGDVVRCVLTPSADAGCLAQPSFTSAPVAPVIHPLPVLSPIAGLTDICLHSSTTLTTGSTGGAWKSTAPAIARVDATGKVTAIGIGAATIRYVSTTAASCQDSVERAITVLGLYTPTLSVSASAKTICAGEPVTFTAVAGPAGNNPRFDWFLNNTATGLSGISYINTSLKKGDVVHVVMTPSADAGCVSSPTINSMALMVTVGLPPVLSPITGNTVLCSGATSQLANATAGVSATWRSLHPLVATVSATGLVTGVGAGTATIRYVGTTAIGCKDSTDVTVTVHPNVAPSLTIDANHNDTCTGIAIQFTAQALQGGTQPFYQWQVNGQPTGTGPQWGITSLRNGDVVRCVLASNATCAAPGSATSNEIVMAIHAFPVINAGPDKTILRGETVLLEGRVSDDVASIHWTPVTGLLNAGIATPKASPTHTTRYQLEASTAKGCSATDEVVVSVIESVKVPNAFSPNGDGIHDTWEIPDLGYVAQVDIQVFNRQGQLVYQAASYQQGKGWNGAFKGYVLPAGTYYYVIDLKNGKPKLSGAVTLLK